MNTTTKTRLMLVAALLVCLPVMALILPAYAKSLQAQADFPAVDAYVEAQRESLNIPGVALAIVQGDQVVYVRGYGQAGPDGRPVLPQTPFQIGSTGKSLTALAIMQLVEDGMIDLDAPVQTYLPWFRVADPQDSTQITVRHLLNQTSGLSNSAGLQEFTANDLSDQAIENSVRRLAEVALERPPGAAYTYSNVNFTILGQVVQTVSGQSYESYVQEHIFDPLDMQHSFTSQDAAIQDGLAQGYGTWFGIPFAKNAPFNRGNLPGGFQFCSAEDLGHYLIAQLNDGGYGSVRVLSAEGMAELHRSAVPIGATELSYAMGWEVGTVDGVQAVSHGGENTNYSAYLLMVPQEKLGIAILTNVNGVSVLKFTEQIAHGVMAVVRGNQPKTYEKQLAFWMIVGSAAVPVTLSVLWIAWTAFRFIRRRKQTVPARRGSAWWTWVIVLPLIMDLGLLGVLLFGIPRLWGLPLSGMSSMFPDMFTLVAGSAVALAVWGMLRTTFAIRSLNPPPPAAR